MSSARRRKARPEARMPRALTLSVALAAIGLIAPTPASAAGDRKEVKTSVKLEWTPDPNDPGGALFSGRVKAKHHCQKTRKVVLYDEYFGSNHPSRAGSGKSNARGKFKIVEQDGRASREGYASRRGQAKYYAVAKKRKIAKPHGDTIVCKKGTSEEVRAPVPSSAARDPNGGSSLKFAPACFGIRKVEENKENGTAELTVATWYPGEVRLRKTKKVKADEAAFAGPGRVGAKPAPLRGSALELLRVKPRGKAKRKLNNEGKVRVKAKVIYRRVGAGPDWTDPPCRKDKQIKLVKR